MLSHLPTRLQPWETSACLLIVACLFPAVPAVPAAFAESVASMDLPATGQSTVETTTRVELDYLIHFPADYDPAGEQTYPLVIFLHGAGERGDDLNKIKKWGPPKFVAEQTLPAELQEAIIVSPQCGKDQWWPSDTMLAALDQMFDDLLAAHAVDPTRVYLTGVSMGGYGTWAWAGKHPKRFAAIAPICGGGSFFNARTIANAKLPVWCFHGDQDNIVPLSESLAMMQTLYQIGHKGNHARLTVFPNTTHNSWTPAYATEELWSWMFSHQRQDTPETEAKP